MPLIDLPKTKRRRLPQKIADLSPYFKEAQTISNQLDYSPQKKRSVSMRPARLQPISNIRSIQVVDQLKKLPAPPEKLDNVTYKYKWQGELQRQLKQQLDVQALCKSEFEWRKSMQQVQERHELQCKALRESSLLMQRFDSEFFSIQRVFAV